MSSKNFNTTADAIRDITGSDTGAATPKTDEKKKTTKKKEQPKGETRHLSVILPEKEYRFLRTIATIRGETLTEFLTALIDKEMKANSELLALSEKALAITEE